MLNAASQKWVIGGWLVALAFVVAASMSLSASLSTTLLLAALGVAPAVVIALLKRGAPAPSVVEILHSLNANDDRR
jgi:hypothetical protein